MCQLLDTKNSNPNVIEGKYWNECEWWYLVLLAVRLPVCLFLLSPSRSLLLSTNTTLQYSLLEWSLQGSRFLIFLRYFASSWFIAATRIYRSYALRTLINNELAPCPKPIQSPHQTAFTPIRKPTLNRWHLVHRPYNPTSIFLFPLAFSCCG